MSRLPLGPGLVRRALLFMVAVFLVVALLLMVTNLNSASGSAHLMRWQYSAVKPDAESWQSAWQASLSAYRSLPYRAEPADDLAILSVTKMQVFPLKPSTKQQLLREAMEYHRQAIRRRPHWGMAWAGLAHKKALAGNLDGEFETAFRTAWQLGPNEEDVRASLVHVGLAHYRRLRPELSSVLHEAIRRMAAIPRQRREVRDIGRQYDQTKLVKQLLALNTD